MESAIANVDLGRYRRIVQMFWDPQPVNDAEVNQPVWCLGRRYTLSTTNDAAATEQNSTEGDRSKVTTSETVTSSSGSKNESATSIYGTQTQNETVSRSSGGRFSLSFDNDEPEAASWPPEFLEDFVSRIWMTYRSGFEAIPKSTNAKAASALTLSMRIKSQLIDQNGFTSDSGWGCMIRSGQSLLANAMVTLTLGRDWRRGILPDKENGVIASFADDPRAPYSIHKFVKHGEERCGKFPGEWFGPSATARCIQALVNTTEPDLRVYSTGDGPDVYEDSFLRIAQPDGNKFHPTLILVGTRLGIDKINPVYWEALIASLQMPQSVGIAGGRPSSSHYFIGSQGHFLFYLDPHYTREALPYHSDPSRYSTEEIESCHTSRLRRLHVREMDPSMLIGFLIRNADDWVEWRSCVKHVQGKSIIHVADRDPANEFPAEGTRSAIDDVELLSTDDEDIK